MASWLAPEQNMCVCSHSIAAHIMTDDGMCGFCFCRRHVHLRQSRSPLSGSSERLLRLDRLLATPVGVRPNVP
jgi:hypothetical protein